MTSLVWLVVVVTCSMAAAAAGWWLTEVRARRRLERRVEMTEQRIERQRSDAQTRAEADRRALEMAVREAEVSRFESQRDASTQRIELAGMVAQRQSVERRLAEVEDVATRSLGELSAAHQRMKDATARERQLETTLERAQRRAHQLATICRIQPGAGTPIYPERPAPAELDAIAGRVRGLAFIDAITIADKHGFPLDRGGLRDADDLAALVPPVSRVAADLLPSLGTTVSVVFYTDDARVVELRALPAWTGHAWLVVQASAQRPPEAALDAAVAYADAVFDREHEAPVPATLQLATRGRVGPGGARTEALGDELERATRGLGTRLVALVLGDQILAGVQADGVPTEKLEGLLRCVQQLRHMAGPRLRADGITRVELDLAGSTRLSLATLGSGSRLSLATLTVGRPLDPLEVERVVGRLRRFLDAGSPLAAAGGLHA